MHVHYGFHEAVDSLSVDKLRKYLKFRANFIGEEYKELQGNLKNPEEVVDALIDICVVAIGTLDLYGVDGQEAWDRVLQKNMLKAVGVKESRPNPLGLPDLIKPEGWTPPSHEGNHGKLTVFVCDCVTETERGYQHRSDHHGFTVSHRSAYIYDVNCAKCGRRLNAEDYLESEPGF
jgi:hypothetical protein